MPSSRIPECILHKQTYRRRQQLNQELFLEPGAFATAAPAAGVRQARALSANTARIYAGAWAAFQAWCRARDAVSLPAAADTVAAYLEACAARLGPGGLRRVLAALAQRHRLAGQPWPAGDPRVVHALAGLKARAVPARSATAFTISSLRQLIAACGEQGDGDASLAACRDRALLLASFAAGLRRSKLVALCRCHVRLARSHPVWPPDR